MPIEIANMVINIKSTLNINWGIFWSAITAIATIILAAIALQAKNSWKTERKFEVIKEFISDLRKHTITINSLISAYNEQQNLSELINNAEEAELYYNSNLIHYFFSKKILEIIQEYKSKAYKILDEIKIYTKKPEGQNPNFRKYINEHCCELWELEDKIINSIKKEFDNQ